MITRNYKTDVKTWDELTEKRRETVIDAVWDGKADGFDFWFLWYTEIGEMYTDEFQALITDSKNTIESILGKPVTLELDQNDFGISVYSGMHSTVYFKNYQIGYIFGDKDYYMDAPEIGGELEVSVDIDGNRPIVLVNLEDTEGRDNYVCITTKNKSNSNAYSYLKEYGLSKNTIQRLFDLYSAVSAFVKDIKNLTNSYNEAVQCEPATDDLVDMLESFDPDFEFYGDKLLRIITK